VRAGIEGTPRGQIEAARSLALSEAQVFLRVVLPPALARCGRR
jgi:polar amino acid transport system permease protein